MNLNDCMHFQGFSPSDFTYHYLRDKINSLLSEAPYGAHCRVTFKKKGPFYTAHLNIHSYAGKFFATATERSLRAVIYKLTSQIRRQLDRWKSQRFKHVSHNCVDLSDYEFLSGKEA